VEVRSHDCVKAFCWVDERVGNAIDADGFLNFKVSWCFMVEACTFLSNPDVTDGERPTPHSQISGDAGMRRQSSNVRMILHESALLLLASVISNSA
jgi:hypothetical protein